MIGCLAECRADVLAVSATIPFHLDAVAALIRAVRMHPEVASVKVLVGGLAFNRDPTLWRKVGLMVRRLTPSRPSPSPDA